MACIAQHGPHICALYVYANKFSAWSKSSPGLGTKHPATSDAPFTSFSDVPPDPRGHHMFMIRDALPMQGLTTVRLEDVVALKEDWIGFLGNLERLEDLEIAQREGGFLAAFSSGISCPELSFLDAVTPGRLKFRRLRRLSFREWCPRDYGGRRHIDILNTCLRERCKRGRGLQRLCLQDCSEVCADDVVDFNHVVMRVVWISVGEKDRSEDDIDASN